MSDPRLSVPEFAAYVEAQMAIDKAEGMPIETEAEEALYHAAFSSGVLWAKRYLKEFQP